MRRCDGRQAHPPRVCWLHGVHQRQDGPLDWRRAADGAPEGPDALDVARHRRMDFVACQSRCWDPSESFQIAAENLLWLASLLQSRVVTPFPGLFLGVARSDPGYIALLHRCTYERLRGYVATPQ